MSAQLTIEGADEFIAQLNRLGSHTEKVAKRICFDGMNVLRDAVVQTMGMLKRDTMSAWAHGRPLNVISQQDLLDMIQCLGISKIGTDDAGAMTVSLSFSGYISRTEKKYPKGVPAVLIARSLESGSSARAKSPFMRKTVNRYKEAVVRTMQRTLSQSIKYINNQKNLGGNSDG